MEDTYHNDCLTDSQNIGEQLKRIRGSVGYTQETAAGLTGHSRDWLANIETGRTPVRFSDVIDLLVAYDRLDDLYHVAFSVESAAGARKSFICTIINIISELCASALPSHTQFPMIDIITYRRCYMPFLTALQKI